METSVPHFGGQGYAPPEPLLKLAQTAQRVISNCHWGGTLLVIPHSGVPCNQPVAPWDCVRSLYQTAPLQCIQHQKNGPAAFLRLNFVRVADDGIPMDAAVRQ